MRSWLALATASALLLTGCHSGTYTTPAPDVHVTVELTPDPPPPRNCCQVTLINPTKQPEPTGRMHVVP